MNLFTSSILLAMGLAVVGIIGDFFIKLSASGAKYVEAKHFIIGLSIYAATAFGWFFVMKHLKLSTLGVFYAMTTILGLVFVGVYFFKESLNAGEIAGIALALVSLALLGRFA